MSNSNGRLCPKYETCNDRNSHDSFYQAFYCTTHMNCVCEHRQDRIVLDETYLTELMRRRKAEIEVAVEERK